MWQYPNIDPICFTLGPLSIRWYGLAYIVGIASGAWLVKKELTQDLKLTRENISDYVSLLVIGILIGGRLGYVFIYDWAYYSQNLLEIAAIWKGGMAYHGGALGAMIASICYAKKTNKSVYKLLDCLGIASTAGIFFGRVANFINKELIGRVTEVPWAVHLDGKNIHPSQLYEAALEGLGLLLVLMLFKKKAKLKDGQLFGLYLIGYALARMFLENFRQPDSQIGFLIGKLTMGQALSVIMVIIGLYFIFRNRIDGNSKMN